jgi:hypothetical protein
VFRSRALADRREALEYAEIFSASAALVFREGAEHGMRGACAPRRVGPAGTEEIQEVIRNSFVQAGTGDVSEPSTQPSMAGFFHASNWNRYRVKLSFSRNNR